MNTVLLVTAWLAPLALALPAMSARGRYLPVVAALPALAAAPVVPEGSGVWLPWLLLGTHIGLDEAGRALLLGGALIWLSAAYYAGSTLSADSRGGRFRFFFLLAMAGNFTLLLAQDGVTFYLGFAVMGLAGYGLVTHRQSLSARRAGRAYLAWAMAGEVLVFAALVVLFAASPGLGFDVLGASPAPGAAVLLLLLGFGIKVALPGLHAWMPPTYEAAPAAAAAVLSGVMVNAGILGWLRLLPLGTGDHGGWGEALLAAGLAGTFYGVAMGLLQRQAKVILAYSSVSQMGLLAAAVGLAMTDPDRAPLLAGAVVLYAVHHGLAKGSLFLATDRFQRQPARWLFALLVLLALALAGAPLTSGALAKGVYKAAIPDHMGWLLSLLAASTVATTLLMARFLVVVRQQRERHATDAGASPLPVVLLAGAVMALPWLPTADASPVPLAGNLWLIIAGAALSAALIWRPLPALKRLVGIFPPGDLPVMAGRRIARALGGFRLPHPPRIRLMRGTWLSACAVHAEAQLRHWSVAGTLWLLLLVSLGVALLATH